MRAAMTLMSKRPDPKLANVIRRAKVELADAQNETICDHEVSETPTVRSPWMTTGPYRAALQTGFELSAHDTADIMRNAVRDESATKKVS